MSYCVQLNISYEERFRIWTIIHTVRRDVYIGTFVVHFIIVQRIYVYCMYVSYKLQNNIINEKHCLERERDGTRKRNVLINNDDVYILARNCLL